MYSWPLAASICYILAATQMIDAGKILNLSLMFSGSHDFIFDAIARRLVEAGHEVDYYRIQDVIVPHRHSDVYNIYNVPVEYNKYPHDSVTKSNLSRPPFEAYWNRTVFTTPLSLGIFTIAGPHCTVFLGNKDLMEKLRKASYDVMLLDQQVNECNLAVAKVLNLPVVTYSVIPLVLEPFRRTGFHANPALMPIIPSKIPTTAGFFNRMFNIYMYFIWEAMYTAYLYHAHSQIQRYVPDLTDMEALYDTIEVVLCNPHPIVMVPRATTDQIKFLGCVTCREAKPLPQNISRLLDSPNGSIVVSFGFSGFKSEFVPQYIIEALTGAFKKIDQNVLIRFGEGYFDGIDNVKAVSWFSQNDVLGHPRLKLIISNCGINTAMEIIFHEMPMLCIPLGADQDDNAIRLHSLGVAEILDKTRLSAEGLYDKITTMLEPPNYTRYKSNLAKYGHIIRNPEIKPVDRALYWIELVMREKRLGYQKSPSFSIPQTFLWDFYLFNLCLIVVFVYLLRGGKKLLCRIIFRKTKLE